MTDDRNEVRTKAFFLRKILEFSVCMNRFRWLRYNQTCACFFQMLRGVIKYVVFLGVLIGIGIITKILEGVLENANIKGKQQYNISSQRGRNFGRGFHNRK